MKPTERKEARNMLYTIRWFDTTKAGKIIVRKYEGAAILSENAITFTYNGKQKTISKDECFAYEWANGMWNAL